VWPLNLGRCDHELAAEDEIDAPPPGDGHPRAKGEAIPRTDADIAELAIVTEADTEDAAQDWRDKTMATYAGLVDAAEEDEG
jgi:hypothetical protein